MLFHKVNEVADFSAKRQDASLGVVPVMGEGSEGALSIIHAVVGKGVGSKERAAAWPGQGVAVAGNTKLMTGHLVFLTDVERVLLWEVHGEVEET